jgi:hypothetical protein
MTKTIPASLYQLLLDVAADARGNMECNCGVGACDGHCTHAMAARALEAATAHDALFGAAQPSEVQRLASELLEPVLPTFDGGDCANWMNDAQELARLVLDTRTGRWASQSAAFQAEKPWCGWTVAFSDGSDWDTTCFGLERLVGINLLLTTADGRSRPVQIANWQSIVDNHTAGVLVQELDAENYSPIDPAQKDFVRYEDIRELVIY